MVWALIDSQRNVKSFEPVRPYSGAQKKFFTGTRTRSRRPWTEVVYQWGAEDFGSKDEEEVTGGSRKEYKEALQNLNYPGSQIKDKRHNQKKWVIRDS
jgi:hypothetical protein